MTDTNTTDALLGALMSPEFLEDPYPFFRMIRETEPVCFIEPFNAWVLTRFDDVRTAFTDDRFRVEYEQHQINRTGPSAAEQAYFQVGKEFLVVNDPPTHTTLKKVFRQPFTAKRVQEMIPMIQGIAGACVERFADADRVDIVTEYAHRVPIEVMSRLLDIPAEYEDQIVEWISAFYAVLFVSPMSPEELSAANTAASDARDLFLDIVRQRRNNPGTDFISDVIAANDDTDDPITDEQIAINAFLLYFAGHDTQKGMFSMMVNTIDRNRDALRYLVEDTNRVSDCAHELYRYDPTGQLMGRTVVEDVELGGHIIKKGQIVMVSMAAANRDPEAFPEPDRLIFDRPMVEGTSLHNMTFGTGRHRCLGAFMAQTNLPIMLQTLLDRVGEFEVDRDNAVRLPTIEVRAFERLPITWSR